MTIEITVPCVAAHLLVTRQQCDCDVTRSEVPLHQMTCTSLSTVLRFLPTDADTECETCEGHGVFPHLTDDGWVDDCDDCIDTPGRRPLRVGDRIAIRADNNVPGHCEELGRWMVTHKGDGTIVMYDTRAGRNYYGAITLHPGEVVGYATVTNVLPIVDGIPSQDSWRTPWRIITTEPWPVVTSWPGYGSAHPELALVASVDAGLVFTPGQIALELAAEG